MSVSSTQKFQEVHTADDVALNCPWSRLVVRIMLLHRSDRFLAAALVKSDSQALRSSSHCSLISITVYATPISCELNIQEYFGGGCFGRSSTR